MNQFEQIVAAHGITLTGTEDVARRTLTGKTFTLDGGRIRCLDTGAPIHFDNEGQLEEIDLTPVSHGQEWVIDKAPYILKLNKNAISGTYQSRATGKITTFDHPGSKKAELDKGCWIWVGISTAKDVCAIMKPAGLSLVTDFNAGASDLNLLWRIDKKRHREGRGWDAEKDPAEIKAGRFTGKVSKIVDKKTRRREFIDATAFPVRVV